MAVEAVPAGLISQLRSILDEIERFNVEVEGSAQPSGKVMSEFGSRITSTNVEIQISDSRR